MQERVSATTLLKLLRKFSKLVAAVCVLQLSAICPKWLGIYANKHENEHGGEIESLSERSIKFNIAWNLWREVAECGVFLIPCMLGNSARSIPVSAWTSSKKFGEWHFTFGRLMEISGLTRDFLW